MLRIKGHSTGRTEIEHRIKGKWEGPSGSFNRPAGLGNFTTGSIIAIETEEQYEKIDFDNYKRLLVFTCLTNSFPKHITVCRVDKPTYYLIYLLKNISAYPFSPGYKKEEECDSSGIVQRGNRVSAGCRIGSDVRLGAQNLVLDNSVLAGRTYIGNNVFIGANCTIGCDYLNAVMSNDEVTVYPALGSIEIGDNAIIGHNCVIEAGTDSDTVIEMNAVIGNSVTIGSNCRIEAGAEVPAGSVLPPNTLFGRKDSSHIQNFSNSNVYGE